MCGAFICDFYKYDVCVCQIAITYHKYSYSSGYIVYNVVKSVHCLLLKCYLYDTSSCFYNNRSSAGSHLYWYDVGSELGDYCVYISLSTYQCQAISRQSTDYKFGLFMMTSSNGNIFRVTGPLCGEFTGHRWIPSTKASDAELWFFSLICVWINGWVNNGEAGDLRRYRAHYDVTVMFSLFCAIGILSFVQYGGRSHAR